MLGGKLCTPEQELLREDEIKSMLEEKKCTLERDVLREDEIKSIAVPVQNMYYRSSTPLLPLAMTKILMLI